MKFTNPKRFCVFSGCGRVHAPRVIMMLGLVSIFTSFLLILEAYRSVAHEEKNPVWKWICENKKCHKVRNYANESADGVRGLEECKMFCDVHGTLWPSPTGVTELGKFVSKINATRIRIQIEKKGASHDLLEAAGRRVINTVKMAIPRGEHSHSTGQSLVVYLINENPNVREFSLDMDESYQLKVQKTWDNMEAVIRGKTFFGVRHGLETLSQLIFYDEDVSGDLVIVKDVNIVDKPAYPYRGILLDTSRNYYSVQSIKYTIDAMAAVKLNTFHWHITDVNSFPFESKRRPSLSKLGAYSPSKVYTMKSIREIVQYGLERGVRVLPEFDAPAHVGEGWQDTSFTVCFNAQPWYKYCKAPPCGQFNPIKEELYEYLEDIYKDMAEVFHTTDLFHMGGDEVSIKCWEDSLEIQKFMIENGWDVKNQADYLKLWDYFQKKAQAKAYSAFGNKTALILWTSTLTELQHIENYLNKNDYIIHVWTKGDDPLIKGLLKKGYRLILSNYDALYLDCGYGSWVSTGNNWCSPYIGWTAIYENNPKSLAGEFNNHHLILGAEAALWSEQADEASLDGRLWPRAAAMAERLWSDPSTHWNDAVDRLLHMRNRFIRMGIKADAVQPEWCFQNEGFCK